MSVYSEAYFKEINTFVADIFFLHKIFYEKMERKLFTMNTWILLLLLLGCSNGCGSCQDEPCRDARDCGRGREHGGGRDRDCDCGHDHDHNHHHDCDGDDSRFEPRFDARPFGGGETCGCEEKNN